MAIRCPVSPVCPIIFRDTDSRPLDPVMTWVRDLAVTVDMHRRCSSLVSREWTSLNSAKTAAVLFWHLHNGRRTVPTVNSIDIAGTVVPLCHTVKLLVWSCNYLILGRPYNLYCVGGDIKPCSINQSINQLPHTALQHIRPMLTLNATNMVGHRIVSSWLDYANAMLFGT